MIKANELRIGNKLQDSNGHYYEVDHGLISQICVVSGDDFYGIPLTPEILEKAGFVKSDGEFGWWLSKKVISGFYYDNTFITRIKSLHQLQNLYFALTGEELPIEL